MECIYIHNCVCEVLWGLYEQSKEFVNISWFVLRVPLLSQSNLHPVLWLEKTTACLWLNIIYAMPVICGKGCKVPFAITGHKLCKSITFLSTVDEKSNFK